MPQGCPYRIASLPPTNNEADPCSEQNTGNLRGFEPLVTANDSGERKVSNPAQFDRAGLGSKGGAFFSLLPRTWRLPSRSGSGGPRGTLVFCASLCQLGNLFVFMGSKGREGEASPARKAKLGELLLQQFLHACCKPRSLGCACANTDLFICFAPCQAVCIE